MNPEKKSTRGFLVTTTGNIRNFSNQLNETIPTIGNKFEELKTSSKKLTQHLDEYDKETVDQNRKSILFRIQDALRDVQKCLKDATHR